MSKEKIHVYEYEDTFLRKDGTIGKYMHKYKHKYKYTPTGNPRGKREKISDILLENMENIYLLHKQGTKYKKIAEMYQTTVYYIKKVINKYEQQLAVNTNNHTIENTKNTEIETIKNTENTENTENVKNTEIVVNRNIENTENVKTESN